MKSFLEKGRFKKAALIISPAYPKGVGLPKRPRTIPMPSGIAAPKPCEGGRASLIIVTDATGVIAYLVPVAITGLQIELVRALSEPWTNHPGLAKEWSLWAVYASRGFLAAHLGKPMSTISRPPDSICHTLYFT